MIYGSCLSEESLTVYNIFAFGYFETDYDILKMFEGASEKLKPKGKLLVDVINGPKILRNFKERDWEEGAERYVLQERTYDAKTKRLKSEWTFIYKDTGETNKHQIVERLCSVNDLVSMIDSVGLKTVKTYGGFDKTEHSEDSNRIIAVAEKI